MKRTASQLLLFTGGVILTIMGGGSLIIQAIRYLPRLSEIVRPAEAMQSFVIAVVLLILGIFTINKSKPATTATK